MSIATNHFPQIKWRENEKWLWNPIRKQALKNRPEERIRLRVIEYLLEAGWSKHRISTEEGITSIRKGKLRTDLICYTDEFDPFLLAECKAPNVNISNQTAEQTARYNKKVKAPFLLMTNGCSDLWYTFKDEKKPVLLDEVPESFQNDNYTEEKTFTYWSDRGFAGKKAGPTLRVWVTDLLNNVMNDEELNYRHLSFKKKLYDTDLNHYYAIHSYPDQRIALAFIDTAYGGSRLIAIANKNSENVAVLEINLDLLFDDQAPNASLYNKNGQKNLSVQKQIDWNEKTFQFNAFAKQVNEWLR